MHVTNGLLSELLAVYHNVNFTDGAKEHLKLTGKDFLRDDARGDDDEGDAAMTEAARAFEARDNLRSGLGLPDKPRSMPLIPRPHATPMPEGLFALLMGEGGDEG